MAQTAEWDLAVETAIAASVHRLWRECQVRALWRSEKDRLVTVLQWADDFEAAGLPLPLYAD